MAENSTKTVWLDCTLVKPDIETHRSLCNSDPYLITFRDKNKCIDYVTNLCGDENRVVLIISNDAALLSPSTLLQLCKELPQIASIYILHNRTELPANVFVSQTTKVQGIYTDTQLLLEQLNQLPYIRDRHRRRKEEFFHDNFSFTSYSSASTPSVSTTTNDVFFPVIPTSDISKRQEAEFMYSRILQDILVRISSTKDEMISFFRNEQATLLIDLNAIEELENYYDGNNAIYWYTRDTFLYRLLNKALREQRIDTLFFMRHFIKHLNFRLKFLHFLQKQNNSFSPTSARIVYRGQLMQKEEFNRKLRHSTGGYFSIHSFFSTTTNEILASIYADTGSNAKIPDAERILFQIHIDNEVNKFPYANIAGESAFHDAENEILFTVGAVFRILSVEQNSQDDWLVQLKLSGEEDEELKKLTQQMRKDILTRNPYTSLANLMFKMAKYVESAVFNLTALEKAETTEDVSDLPLIHHNLGSIYDQLGDQAQAIKYYEKSLEIRSKHSTTVYAEPDDTYNNLGTIYQKQGDYEKALFYYNKGLEIVSNALNPKHRKMALLYHNIGSVYHTQQRYSDAREMYEKSLQLRLMILPSNHPDIAATYNNIAGIYVEQGDSRKATEYLEKTLETQLNSLPADHPSFVATYQNLADISYDDGQAQKALYYLNKALENELNAPMLNHSAIAARCSKIGQLYSEQNRYSEALEMYEKSIEFGSKILPPNQPDNGAVYNNIALIYIQQGDFVNAIEYLNKALEIELASHSSQPSHLSDIHHNLAMTLHAQGKKQEALEHMKIAYETQSKNFPPNHPTVVTEREWIDDVLKELDAIKN